MCVNCGQSKSFSSPKAAPKAKQTATCDYTVEQIQIWKDKILCIIASNLYLQAGVTRPQLNGFLGVINSIVIYNNNPCTFINTLQKVLDLMVRLTGLGLC